MITCTSSKRMDRRSVGVLAAMGMLLGTAGLLGGCATTGGGSGAEAASPSQSTAETPAAGLIERDFYADWYDSTAVVLPPPPGAAKARR